MSRVPRATAIAVALQGFGLGLGFVTSLLTTRAMDPVEFGRYRYVAVYALALSTCMSFGVPHSLGRLTANAGVGGEMARLVGVGAMFIILSIGPLSVGGAYLARVGGNLVPKEVGGLLAYGGLAGSVQIGYSILQQVLPARGDRLWYGLSQVLPACIVGVVLCIVLAQRGRMTGETALALYTISMLVPLLVIWISRFGVSGPTLKAIKITARDIVGNGIHLYQATLLNVLTNLLIVPVVGWLADVRNAGLFGLALNLVSPLTIIPTAYATLHLRDFANSKRLPGDIEARGLLLAAGLMVLLLSSGGLFVSALLPRGYHSVSHLMIALAPGAAAMGAAMGYNRWLVAHGQGRVLLVCSFHSAVGLGIFGTVLGLQLGSLGMALALSTSQLIYLFSVWATYKRELQRGRDSET